MNKEFVYQEILSLGEDHTPYRHLGNEGVSISEFEGHPILKVSPEALTRLTREAVRDASFLMRPSHLAQVAAILDDPEATDNDRFVALSLLRNAEVSAKGILPFCQDTGTATILGKKGQRVWTGVDDAQWISRGVFEAFQAENLRYSQVAALDMYREVNTGTNLPAQIDIQAVAGDTYEFLCVLKGGGSANKMLLFQETKALLNPTTLKKFMIEKMKTIGTSACPPYHLVFVIGGTSAEACMKTLKLASARYLDTLPTTGNENGRGFRDLELEQEILEASRTEGFGAQFGGKYFCLDVRVIRLPRHGASCPVGMGVSCSADRNIKAKITHEGLFLEQLEMNPGRFIPEHVRAQPIRKGIAIDLNQPMDQIRATLDKYPVTTQLALTGTIVVARDMAHAKFKELLDQGKPLPDYIKRHPIYYAGPAKKPEGMASGSFGPTTAGRMDAYVDLLQSHGASLIMIAKGNRSDAVTEACARHGGFYLGSIGGPAALLAQEHIRKVELLDYEELGMEAVWKIEVEDFPAFILVDNKGNNFFKMPSVHCGTSTT